MSWKGLEVQRVILLPPSWKPLKGLWSRRKFAKLCLPVLPGFSCSIVPFRSLCLWASHLSLGVTSASGPATCPWSDQSSQDSQNHSGEAPHPRVPLVLGTVEQMSWSSTTPLPHARSRSVHRSLQGASISSQMGTEGDVEAPSS